MDRYLLSAPNGFNKAIATIETALGAADVAKDLILRAARGTIRPDETQKIKLYQNMFAAKQVVLTDADIVNTLRCLAYINRGASSHCEKGSVKSLGKALVGATNASDEVAAAIAQAWAATASLEEDSAQEEVPTEDSFSVGKLQGLDWKLGVRLSSSNCDRLSAPFVRLVRPLISACAHKDVLVGRAHASLLYALLFLIGIQSSRQLWNGAETCGTAFNRTVSKVPQHRDGRVESVGLSIKRNVHAYKECTDTKKNVQLLSRQRTYVFRLHCD